MHHGQSNHGFTGDNQDSYGSLADYKSSVPSYEFDDPKDVKAKTTEEKKEQNEEDDAWALPELKDDTVPWEELDDKGKFLRVAWLALRLVLLLGLLYLFICSLDFLSSAFRLLGGSCSPPPPPSLSLSLSHSLSLSLLGLMVGVLATVLVQSSSTSTSIIVSMVSARILSVRLAIPIAMGANIGTTVTNTLVSMGQMKDKGDFRRAFAAATVHDMFNWLCVIVFLPIEVASGYLYRLTDVITSDLTYNVSDSSSTNPKLLKAITEPFTKTVIDLSSSKLELIAKGVDFNGSLIKSGNFFLLSSGDHLFSDWEGTDAEAGAILLVVSLALLCLCLICVVKILSSLLKGTIAKVIQRVVNADFPGPCKYFTGYFVILVGAGLTILVQSSSIFTSALTPLVGIGAIHLERMFPLTLGSNIGTTVTGILASLTSDPSTFKDSFQIALCHLFFNISGLLLWYPAPFMRKLPINMAKFMGQTVHQYRWFAIVYLFFIFFLAPLFVFGLSLAGWEVLVCVGVPIVVLVICIIIVNILQDKSPKYLPRRLRNWESSGIPAPLRSLEPYDRVFVKLSSFCKCCLKEKEQDDTNGQVNMAYDEENKIESNHHFKGEMVNGNGCDFKGETTKL
ncbi:sodium-dependent phosphate transport protein 2B-like [Aplysia californica]|uniref:Sodium-dependent phosphate transport protein 2B-like n=1 Tax=Aplysia californica TaxID=6500 RepID=A0ABM1VVL3_APLCA|nr:sodium-dependent phosphate transport protein 2B-like [Aplysia californica]